MIPLLAAAGIGAAGSALSGWLSGRQTDEQKAMWKAQLDATKANAGRADQLGQWGQSQYNLAMPALTQAQSYWSSAAGFGGSGKLLQQLQPQATQINDTYTGALGNAMRSLGGAQRARAIAELNRQRAGQIGNLYPQARFDAVKQLGQFGQTGVDSAGRLMGGAIGGGDSAAGNYRSLYGQATDQANTNYARTSAAGADWAKTWLPALIKQYASGGGNSTKVVGTKF